MKGFGGFKSSPAQLKENYIKGFKNMSDRQLKNVIKRQEARGTSKKTAFESIKDAETSLDSLQTAKKELNRRKLDKMDPSGRIRKSTLLPKKSSPTKADKKLIDIADKMGQKGTDMLKEKFGSPSITPKKTRRTKAKEAYKKVSIPKIKYKKVAKGVRGPVSPTEIKLKLPKAKQDKTRTSLGYYEGMSLNIKK